MIKILPSLQRHYMHGKIACCIALLALGLLTCRNAWSQNILSLLSDNAVRSVVLFDDGWRFHRGAAQGADQPGFGDSGWRNIDLPHDWSIEDLPGTNSPFNRDAIGQVCTGFTTGGTGWYRKSFIIPSSQKGRRIAIRFDGVYMNADVWINGQPLGNHPYGYTGFAYDITSYIKYDTANIIAVEVKNEGQNSRWYAGSGIYRHVWLSLESPVHVAQWGTAVTTPSVTAQQAAVNIKTKLVNESSSSSAITLVTKLVDHEGREVAKTSSAATLGAGNSAEVNQDMQVMHPALWSVDSPTLYAAVSMLYAGSKLIDSCTTTFGIRYISFDAVNGFRLNGKPMKLKGGCFHIDNGPLGTKSFDRAEERRVALMKASGFNAIRCSHNPPAPAFLEACDRLGMLVIDEAFDMWQDAKIPYDYHLYFDQWWQKDMSSMLLRDRNHPCIIMWSIGNEIPGMDEPRVAKMAATLAAYVRKTDPTRPVTAAVNGVTAKKDAFFSALDICGYNYARDQYESDHRRKPQRIMYATESYPLEAFDYWMAVLDHPWVIGDFVWTGFDYIGEASIGWLGYMQQQDFYPWNLAYCGDIDICGWKRPQSYYRDALWKKDQLSIFVKPPQPSFAFNPKKESWSIWNWHDVVADWSWQGYENKPLEVNVYSSCEAVELFLNGKSLGRQQTGRSNKYTATWQVPYQPGTLKAVGYNGTQQVNTATLRTAAKPVQISLSADRDTIRSGGQDLSYVTVELTDANSVRDPKADDLVKFSIDGPGTIAGVGNANPVSLESYQQPQRKAWQGRCLAIIRSGKEAGDIVLTASAAGLPDARIVIHVSK